MPHINLNPNYPGIIALFMYDKGVAKTLSAMAEEVMRRPADLSVGDRELIASHVSNLNNCKFCTQSHTACAMEYGKPGEVTDVIIHGDASRLNPKLASLLDLAAMVTFFDRRGIADMVAECKEYGATDSEIHDTVFIASFFNMCNRYVDGLGTTFKPEEAIEGGRGLAKYGYLMSARRFFGEILPKLWRGFRTKYKF